MLDFSPKKRSLFKKFFIESLELFNVSRKLISIFFVVLNLSLNAQTEQNPKDPLDIVQASPTANSLGTYGGVNVGKASGTISKSIDLYNFISGKLDIPISVNYASNGLKVNDNGGIVGTGWSIKMGGTIRKTIYGNVDGGSRLPVNFNPYSGSREYLNYLKGLISYNGMPSVIDGEYDLYTFDFNNYSGSFILDENNTPLLLNYSGIKISRVSATQFIITTPDGVKYDFNVGETSLKVGNGCGKIITSEVNTAFFLTKITHPSGDIINLLYNSSNYTYVVGVEESQTYQRRLECDPADLGLKIRSCVISIFTKTKLLKEINGSNGKVVFNYQDHQAATGMILSDFKIYNSFDASPIKQVVFNYVSHKATNGVHNANLVSQENLKYRSFLKTIAFLNANGLVDNKYSFDYQNLERLPYRFANNQDYYGYNNGKGNSTLIPKSNVPNWSAYFVNTNANREPDATYISAGMLSKITYPTGGADSLIYEPNTAWKEYTVPPVQSHGNVTAVGTGTTVTGTETSPIFTVLESQSITINFSCNVTVDDGPYPGTGIVELLSNGVVIKTGSAQAGNSGSFTVTISPGSNYQVRVKANRGYRISCTANYSYNAGQLIKAYRNEIIAGLRIKEVITKTNTTASSKKYFYHKIADLEVKSTGYSIFSPTFVWSNSSNFRCSGNVADCTTAGVIQIITLSSTSRFGYMHFNSAPVYYSDVFEVDNVTNGGVAYQFGVSPNGRPHIIQGEDLDAPSTSNDAINGLELHRAYFKYNGNQIVYLKSIKTTYKNDERIYKAHRSFVANERYVAVCSSGENNAPLQSELDPYDLLEYDHIQRWIYPDTITTKNYATNGIEYSEEVEVNIYDNPNHAQLSRKITVQSTGVRIVNHILYPNDYTLGETFINNMVTNQLSGYPIENVLYREIGNTKSIISGSVFNYKIGGKGLIDYKRSLNTDSSIPLSSFKFSNRTIGILPPSGTLTIFFPDSRYINEYKILTYTTIGRPQEVKKEEEPVTTYLWGYGGQYPIAEIKNANYAEVFGVLGQTTINNFNVPSVSDIVINNAMENLRSNLPKAMVTSYTYQPLVGMKSKTDPRGMTEYYEYDGMQRLKAILDQFKNVRSALDYHYRPN